MRQIIMLALALVLSAVTALAQTPLIGKKDDYSAAKMQKMWDTRIAGKNLALGKSVAFAPTPSYHLTAKGNSDSVDLTDGVLDKRGNQAIWWNPKAVGWCGIEGLNKRIIIDLEKPECVGKIVWRVVAGSHKRGFQGPKSIKLYGSIDGKKVYPISERYRWAEDNARPDNYRMPNIGSPETGTEVYVYPVEISGQNYKMRFVIIEFEQDSVWFCSDELAVIQGEGAGRDITGLTPETMQTADVWIKSPEPVLPVVKGTMLPLWFRQTDFRKSGKKLAVKYNFTLPDGIKLHAPRIYRSKVSGNVVVVESVLGGNSNKIGPFFFEQTKDLSGPVEVKYHAVGIKADAQPVTSLRLEPKTLPEPFKLNKLTISIGWMTDGQQSTWIDFDDSYGRLGFNTVPGFPRGWSKDADKAGFDLRKIEESANPADITAFGRRFEKQRKLGYKVVYMESPLHMVNWQYGKESTEFKCQLKPTPVIDSFCPSYRGKYYTGELERIRKCFLLMGGADYVIWDCELLGSAKWNGLKCERCQKALAASGMTWEAFVKSKTIEMLRDMKAQIKAAAQKRNWTMPEIGMYGVDASYDYASLLKFPADGLFNFQNPSLYVGNNPLEVHKKIRECRSLSTTNNIIPWLTTSTGGKVSPRNVRIMLWEALVNGSCGVTYYCLTDFNPAQLYEVCRALAAIAPVEDIIFNGTQAYSEFKLVSGQARISAVKDGSKAVLLLVNPTAQEQTVKWLHKSGKKGETVLKANDAELLTISL